MHVTFLGTSAGSPTRTRNVTAQVIRFDDGRSWMLDCGEGTQHRIIEEGLRAKPIERILITHLHGDHCYGLPGLLSLMAIHGRTDPVVIHGPPGVRELVETSLRLSCNHLPYGLTISEIETVGHAWSIDGWSISAWPLEHRIPSWGYVIQEPERRGRFHPDRAQAQGVPPGPLYKRLQAGESITVADGRVVNPDTVCDPPRPGRKLVLLGDTAGSSAIHEPGRNCDLLVHEATYAADRTEAAITWGHSTAPMAGACAAAMQARQLVLTHISARYDDGDSVHPSLRELVTQAAAECPGTEVHIADDSFTINVP